MLERWLMKSICIVGRDKALALKLCSSPSLSRSWQGMWSVKLCTAPSPQPQLQGCSWDPGPLGMGWLSVFSGFILKLTRDQREKKTNPNKPTKQKQTNQLSRNQQKVGAVCWQMLCWCWAKTSQLGILSLDCTQESAHGSMTGDNCHVSTAGAICPCVQLILEAGLWWFQLRCKPALHLVLKYCEVALSSSSNAAGVCKFWMTE